MTDSFLIYKPINVLCSTVDACANSSTKNDDQVCLTRNTVYDIAAASGFPTNFPLVGRLDFETSGIMLFTKNHELFMEINTPIAITCDTACLEDMHTISKLYEYKMKHYEVKLLAGAKVISKIKNGMVLDPKELECIFSQPFTFHRRNVTYQVNEFHKVRVLRIYQDPLFSKGRLDLGWCIDLEVIILEGKHHQIRRMAARNHFIVVSLHRKKIAGILEIDERLPFPGCCRWVSTAEETTILENIGRLRLYLSKTMQDT